MARDGEEFYLDITKLSQDEIDIFLDITKQILSWIKHPAVMQEWGRQIVIAFRRSSELIGKPRRSIQGLDDLPYIYLVLADVHDRFDKINRIITRELWVQWPWSLKISHSAALCQVWLEYVKTDLIQKGLLQEGIEVCADLSEMKNLKPEGSPPPNSESTAKKKSPPPSRLRAYQSQKYVKDKNAELKSATLKQIYDWLADSENMSVEDHPYYGRKMPKYETWEKYVREAQQHYGTQRNQPRAGRSYGRSVVREYQIEYSSSQQPDKNGQKPDISKNF